MEEVGEDRGGKPGGVGCGRVWVEAACRLRLWLSLQCQMGAITVGGLAEGITGAREEVILGGGHHRGEGGGGGAIPAASCPHHRHYHRATCWSPRITSLRTAFSPLLQTGDVLCLGSKRPWLNRRDHRRRVSVCEARQVAEAGRCWIRPLSCACPCLCQR